MPKRTKNRFTKYAGMQPIGKEISVGRNNKGIFETVQIRKCWLEIVGEVLAKKTFVKKYQAGKVWVGVEHNGWAYQLNMMKLDMIAKIKKRTKLDIQDIKFTYDIAGEEFVVASSKPVKNKFHKKESSSRKEESIQDILERVRQKSLELQKNEV